MDRVEYNTPANATQYLILEGYLLANTAFERQFIDLRCRHRILQRQPHRFEQCNFIVTRSSNHCAVDQRTQFTGNLIVTKFMVGDGQQNIASLGLRRLVMINKDAAALDRRCVHLAHFACIRAHRIDMCARL